MLGRELCSGELIDRDDGNALGRAASTATTGISFGNCGHGMGRDRLRRDDQDSPDALGPQPPDRVEDGAAVERQEADDADEIARPWAARSIPNSVDAGP